MGGRAARSYALPHCDSLVAAVCSWTSMRAGRQSHLLCPPGAKEAGVRRQGFHVVDQLVLFLALVLTAEDSLDSELEQVGKIRICRLLRRCGAYENASKTAIGKDSSSFTSRCTNCRPIRRNSRLPIAHVFAAELAVFVFLLAGWYTSLKFIATPRKRMSTSG